MEHLNTDWLAFDLSEERDVFRMAHKNASNLNMTIQSQSLAVCHFQSVHICQCVTAQECMIVRLLSFVAACHRILAFVTLCNQQFNLCKRKNLSLGCLAQDGSAALKHIDVLRKCFLHLRSCPSTPEGKVFHEEVTKGPKQSETQNHLHL